MNIEKYYILIAEGITDCSLLEAVLEQYLQYKAFTNVNELPELFRNMIGRYPGELGELKRTDSPMFYYKDTVGIAVKQANGCSNIATKACALIEVIDQMGVYDQIGGFLFFEDTDEHSEEKIRMLLNEKFQENDMKYSNDIIYAYGHRINCRLHLFPTDGRGAIEKLLLECADKSYKSLTEDAAGFRMKILESEYDDIRRKCWANDKSIQEFYADKVQFGAISAVLKPDRPIRFSIKDKIIRKEYYDTYMKIEEFKKLYDFLNDSL